MKKSSSVCWLLCTACLIWREYLVLDGGMLQKAKIRCVCVRVSVFVGRRAEGVRCEVLDAALCSLKGPGCRPTPCSSSTVLHVSHPLPPPLASYHLSSSFLSSSSSSSPPSVTHFPVFTPSAFPPPLPSSSSITATKHRRDVSDRLFLLTTTVFLSKVCY